MPKINNLLKGKYIFLLRALVSAGLVFYLLWVIDWQQAITSMRQANKLLLLGVPLITLLGFTASAARWTTILADNHIYFSWFQAFRGYILGLFYGIFLPGVLGGDAVRIGICVQKTRCSVAVSTAAVLLERVSGVVSLFCLLFFANIVSPKTLNTLLSIENGKLIPILGIIGLLLILIIVFSRKIWFALLPDTKSGSLWTRILRFIRAAASTLVTLQGRSLLLILVFSILFQVTDIFATFFLSKAIGLQLSPMVFFVVIPLTYLVLMLPISLGGLGLREGTMAFLLSQFGIATSDAIMLSFLIYLNRMIIGLLGGGYQLLDVFIEKKQKVAKQQS